MDEMILLPSSTPAIGQDGLDSSTPDELRGAIAAKLYLSTLPSESARKSMRSALSVIACIVKPELAEAHERRKGTPGYEGIWPFFPWHRLRIDVTLAIRAKLLGQYAPRTVNKMLAAMAGTLRAAWKKKFISADDYQQAVDFKRAKVTRVPVGREIVPDEMDKLIVAARETPGLAGYRDAALIATMYGAGLRREEAVELDRLAYDGATGELRVVGKGNKARTTYIDPDCAVHLDEWLRHRGDHSGPLFPRLHKSGGLTSHALTVSAANRLLKKLEALTGAVHFTPHDMRRSFATRLLDANVDIITVKELLGHSSVDTTAIYDRRGERAKKEAVAKLSRKQRT